MAKRNQPQFREGFSPKKFCKPRKAKTVQLLTLKKSMIPAAPINLTNDGAGTLEWGLPEEVQSLTAYRAINGGAFSQLDEFGSATTYTDPGFNPANQPAYYLIAYGGGGPSEPSQVTYGTPLAPDIATVEFIDADGEIEIKFVHALLQNEAWVTSFIIEREINAGGFSVFEEVEVGNLSIVSGQYVHRSAITGLNPDDAVNYRIKAKIEGHESEPSNESAVVLPEASQVLTNLQSSVTGSASNGLTWTNPGGDATAIKVERNTSRGSFSPLETLAGNATEAQDNTVDNSSGYTVCAYRVKSLNGMGESGWTNQVESKPRNFDVSSWSIAGRSMSWTLGAGDPSLNTGIEVWRSLNGSEYALVATTDPNATSYDDNEDLTASLGATIKYKIRAVNSVGESEYSDEDQSLLVL